MTTTVRAVYENQVLRLDVPLSIANGTAIEVILNLPEMLPTPRNRFSWENGPVLPADSYSGDIADEIRRQRDAE
jgi:predicted DNA-binding antitoxin AbrB/MazE fold protein